MVFIEKVSQSQGLKKIKDNKSEEKIKSQKLDKMDLMGPLRKKYEWFFTAQEQEKVFQDAAKGMKPNN